MLNAPEQSRRPSDDSRRAGVPSGVLGIWVLVSLLARVGLCAMSTIRPVTDREQLITVWPPQPPLSAWFERVWFAPLERWDVEYYIRIATTGYRLDDGTLQFHPLYPALARPFVLAGVNPLVALSIISATASLLLIVAFHRLARLRMGPSDAQFAVLGFVLSPFALALLVPYPEALFLLFAVLCLYWAKTERWWWAGAAGALATLTRQQGLFLVAPLLWMMFEQIRSVRRVDDDTSVQRESVNVAWLAVLALPLAYACWLVYRASAFGDLRVQAAGLHDLVYSLFISPSAAQVVPVQTFLWPWDALARGVTRLVTTPDLDIITNLIGGVWFVALLTGVWRHLEAGDRVYTAAITLVSFAYHTGPVHPYMGLLRHLLLGFPIYLGVPLAIRAPLGRVVVIALGLCGLSMALILYGLEVWVL